MSSVSYSASSSRKADTAKHVGTREERKGLLSDPDDTLADKQWSLHSPDADPSETDSISRPWSRKRILCAAISLIVLLATGAFARSFLLSPPQGSPRIPAHPNLAFHGDELRSNGTHDFRRTVLIVSIDGLRADYLDRGLTPHLLDISKQGLRAKSLIPIFPVSHLLLPHRPPHVPLVQTLTFPNHWALMTGLYAESNGIVGNNFWDPITETEFHYNRISSAWVSRWWLGEPMWETAGKSNIITANLMWPGPPKTTSGATSTYFVPWKDHVPLQEKLDQLVRWIDLPLEERPQLLMAYEPSLDQAGHKAGPMSKLVNITLEQVDLFAKNLHTALEERNLIDIVDVVFVSDHGMTDTSHPELIYMDDIIGKEAYAAIEHEDGWPAMGLWFNEKVNATHNLLLLEAAAAKSNGKFEVFTRDTMSERWHFSHNERIAPIYVVPKIGYVLTNHGEENAAMSKGSHGYDNHAREMQAMFVAHGPFSSVVKILHQRRETTLSRRLLSNPNVGWHSTADDVYVMDPFENVQIYSLVMRLLGVEAVAPTNGSSTFWDKYFS
ncbi:unnamed protein product [Mycena citricolor]|uniref:Phosphodiest-domain-containing protein n=1 Tax=Mycena citricolor TaxID=2018698 RepID=A0AAD2HXL3_9AGAR|nr:unnamed protein product [Mycena citricolor]